MPSLKQRLLQRLKRRRKRISVHERRHKPSLVLDQARTRGFPLLLRRHNLSPLRVSLGASLCQLLDLLRRLDLDLHRLQGHLLLRYRQFNLRQRLDLSRQRS